MMYIYYCCDCRSNKVTERPDGPQGPALMNCVWGPGKPQEPPELYNTDYSADLIYLSSTLFENICPFR